MIRGLILSRKGCDVWAVDKYGCSAGHWAAYMGNIGLLRTLNNMSFEFDSKDNEGNTCLHRAVDASQSIAVEYLIELGCDIKITNRYVSISYKIICAFITATHWARCYRSALRSLLNRITTLVSHNNSSYIT